jgi:hypothetical protein
MQATALYIRSSATHRIQMVPGRDRPGRRPAFLDNVVVVVSFLTLIGIALLGGGLMLLSWVATTLPASPRIVCPELGRCEVPGPDETQDLLVGDHRNEGPTLTR